MCYVYSAPDRAVGYCDEHVCLSVCLSAIISLELHVRSSPNFLCMLPIAMAQPPSGGTVIRISSFTDDIIFAHKLTLLNVTARLR